MIHGGSIVCLGEEISEFPFDFKLCIFIKVGVFIDVWSVEFVATRIVVEQN